MSDLVDAARPVSLYLVIPPSDISRTKPLVRLVLNQIGRRLTEQHPDHSRNGDWQAGQNQCLHGAPPCESLTGHGHE